MIVKFIPGRVVVTPGALRLFADAGVVPGGLIRRHVTGDWGEICEEDRRLNDESLLRGSRLMSAYKLTNGETVWVITEAVEGDPKVRELTTFLLPDEY
jgi:hypothetical protein